MTRYIEPGTRRIMDIAHFTDVNGIKYTGEALMIALLLHTKEKSNRAKQDVEFVGKLLNDPNQE